MSCKASRGRKFTLPHKAHVLASVGLLQSGGRRQFDADQAFQLSQLVMGGVVLGGPMLLHPLADCPVISTEQPAQVAHRQLSGLAQTRKAGCEAT
jgi:hypothetical protein